MSLKDHIASCPRNIYSSDQPIFNIPLIADHADHKVILASDNGSNYYCCRKFT